MTAPALFRLRHFFLLLGLLLNESIPVSAADRSPADLAKQIANPQASLGERITALVSLGSKSKALRDDAELAQEVAPAVYQVVTAPPEGDPKAVTWLVSSGLELLPSLPVTPEVIEAVAKILTDSAQDLDLRVRAAVALGQLAPTNPPENMDDALGAIRRLAITSLQSELDTAARRRLRAEFSMGSLANMSMTQPGETAVMQEGMGRRGGREGGFGGADAEGVSKAECRRAAWRLAELADAIAPAKGSKSSSPGLAAALEGPNQEVANTLAEGIRVIALTSLLKQTLPPDPNDPQATSGAAGGRGGMDGFGGVPNSFDAVIEAALEEAEALPEFSASE